jgi:perosamine synthetase
MNYKKKIKSIKNKFGKFNSNEVNYVLNVIDDKTKNIDYVRKLEDEFCKKFKVKYAIACNSGTSGLHSSLAAIGVGPGDEVIVPGLTVVMDAYAAIHLGAKPVFADVDEDTFLVTAETIKKKISKKTKAIMLVSLQGLPVDIEPIKKLAKKENIFIVEDNAQDFFGTYKNKISGTIGDIGVWSFENKKHLSGASEGGIITTNSSILAEKIRKFAGIGYKNMSANGGRTSLAIEMVQDPDYERFDTIGLNYRMPKIVAAVCYAQLKNYKKIINNRIQVAKIFRDVIKNCDWLLEQKIPKGFKHTHYTFSARYIGQKKFNISWKNFYNQYKKMGGDGFYGACVCPHLEPSLRNFFKKKSWKINKLNVSEKIQKEIMQFKTNYRNLDEAKKKANILSKLINKINYENAS